MLYFLTGGSGFIGKNLIERLKTEGHQVYNYTRNQSISVIKDIKPDVIFHLAAELYDADKMFNSNVRLTYDLLEASSNINYKAFIYVGSSSEYGRKKSPIAETDSLVPDTLYEATKGAASLLCQAYMHNKPIAIARPFSVYGKYEPEKKFVPTIFNCYKHKKPLMLANGVHDWIYIDDFIDGLMLLISNTNKIVNFGTGIQTTNQEVVSLFEEMVGEKIEVVPVDKLRFYDSDCWVCNTNYAKTLGFACKYTLKKGLEKCMEYFAKT